MNLVCFTSRKLINNYKIIKTLNTKKSLKSTSNDHEYGGLLKSLYLMKQ